MNLHEYQAKQLFRRFDLPVSDGKVANSPEEAVAATRELRGDSWAVKVQVHAGGRGKAGGVKVVSSPEGVRQFAEKWIGSRIHTVQTGETGQPVKQIYVEEIASIREELYLGVVVDRALARIVVIASREGGVEIEEVAEKSPEKILSVVIDPEKGAEKSQGIELGNELGLDRAQIEQFSHIFLNVVNLFENLDCSLLEINPLVIKTNGDLHCLDAKLSIDSNAMFRHPELVELEDTSQDDPREVEARQFNLNYVALDGNIGCMVNGAGLAMGTMDLVKLYGGEPANFLDVGGGVDTKSVSEAFQIILSDANVKAVLINIFGGIVSCATIADGIVNAVTQVGVKVPVVVRFDGNSAAQGTQTLVQSGLNLIAATDLKDAAQKAVEAVQNGTPN